MSEVKRPLEGVKVLELATFVAVPACARYLADLGAEVIKIESLTGDPLRYTAVNEGRPDDELEQTSYDLDNAGKKCIALNTKDPAGRKVLDELLAQADIFVTNWRQPALERAGLDYETLKAQYPKLVYGIVSGYGEKGPDKDLPGFDFTSFFARGGVLGTMFDKDSVPLTPIAGFGDHQVAMNLASGLIAALYKVEKGGNGDKVIVSLLHSALWDIGIMLQSAQYGHPSTQYPISRKHIANPLQMAHRTRDGRWLQIAVPRYDFHYPKFVPLIGREDLIDDPRFYPQSNLQENLEEFYDILVKGFAEKDLEEWKQILTEADIPFAVAQTWNEVLVDEQAWASDCLYAMEYPTGNTRTLVRTPVMFTEAGLPPYVRGPYLGEHTREILTDLGYTAEQVDSMLAAGVARQRN